MAHDRWHIVDGIWWIGYAIWHVIDGTWQIAFDK